MLKNRRPVTLGKVRASFNAVFVDRIVADQYPVPGRFQSRIQMPEQGERQDDAPELGALDIATEQVADRPDKPGEGLSVHRSWSLAKNRFAGDDMRYGLLLSLTSNARWS